MLRLTYRSRPTVPFLREEVVALVRDARQRNEKDGITGLLVYDHQSFFQILEGEADAVEACFARIQRDPRHQEIDVMGRQDIDRRAFGSWRMGSMLYEGGG